MFRILMPSIRPPLSTLRPVALVSSFRLHTTPSSTPFDADDGNEFLQPIEEVIPEASSSTRITPITSSQKGADREPIDKTWRAHREAMKRKFPEGWDPPKRLSRDNMDRLRAMHKSDPGTFTTPVLAQEFKISVEAVRRILKSRWEPSEEKLARKKDEETRKKDERLMLYKEMRARRDKWRESQRQLRGTSDVQPRSSSPRPHDGSRSRASGNDGFMLR
ncbi:Required for respiratory growth protein 9 mitochondrial [Tulasnella sp. 330]|nr:Required for respiratory growth protein 9 mitochondrial [Tulasnella sp. 330]KAG8871730.1 Required for respiratory growth protein 9 mitochondrial [Tulasnella sp. 331]KAG8878216.1 Required for respiratory growth protein 9 mitochondrial [Tulasnella sp. 332]